MIDTIVLMLQADQFSIADHARFSPSTKGFFEPPYYPLGGRGNFSCYQNPTAEELRKGIYKPRLTMTKRPRKGGFQITLRVEFSIPKLIFGNNFDEVEDNHFAPVVDNLLKSLREMGIIVFREKLVNASVSAVHYSKNILLPDYLIPSGILNEIAKINLTKALDLNQTDFRNDGHSLKFHANSYELALYDKMRDLEKSKISEKRAVEKDTVIQRDLFDILEPKKKPFEVLRIEARLNKREVIKRTFKKLEIKADLTFAQVFKKEIAQKVLLLHLDIIKKGYAPFAYMPKSAKDFIADLRIIQPKAKPRKILQMLGFITACNETGIREFREAIERLGKHHWPRLLKDWQGCKFTANRQTLKPLEDGLAVFAPLRLGDYCQRKETLKKAGISDEML